MQLPTRLVCLVNDEVEILQTMQVKVANAVRHSNASTSLNFFGYQGNAIN